MRLESKEQLVKAEMGLKNGDEGRIVNNGTSLSFPDFDIAHAEAIKSGDKVDGNQRVSNNVYVEKDGSMTKQTITPNDSTGRNTVTKEKL